MTTIQYKLLWLCDQVPTALGATLEEDGVAFTTTDNSRTAIQEALHKGTDCDITTSALGIVAIEHMRDSEYHNHPCYDAFKLEAYIGAPLWRQNKVVGTVNFSAAEARKAFSQEEVTRVLFLAKMITQLQVEEESHSYTAKDHLTGLFTRKHGEEVLDALTKTPSLERQFGITFIDLDDFKEVNDTHGHSAGDVVLRTCAERLLHATRPDDTVCRWGGDEFLIISPRCEHANAQAILGRISRQLKQPINFDGLSCSIGVSGGFAHGGECQDWNHLIELADSRMYRAKRSQKTWEKPRLVKTN